MKNSPLKFDGKSNFPEWFSKELKQLVVKKKIPHRTFKSIQMEKDYLRFSVLRRERRELLKRCYSDYKTILNSTIPNNIKVFWGHVNSQMETSIIPSRVHLDGIIAQDPPLMSELFARFFTSVYRVLRGDPVLQSSLTSINLSSCFVSYVEMEKKLESLEPNKGPGPDSIPTKVLKYCSSVIAAQHRTILCNLLMEKIIFPSNLKVGYITPIHKSGEVGDVPNYRPVVI